MKHFIKITFTVTLLFSAITCLEYKEEEEEDVYVDDADQSKFLKDFSYEEDDVKPVVYDLRKAPQLFEKFVKDFNKEYENEEDYKKHYKNFVSNLRFINNVNSEGRSSSVDINLFSDLGDDEISKL